MRSVKYPKYDFIAADDKYLKHTGYCVRDCFVGKYSEKIKKLNNHLFDILCFYGSDIYNVRRQIANKIYFCLGTVVSCANGFKSLQLYENEHLR